MPVDGGVGSEIIDTYYGPTEFRDADVTGFTIDSIQQAEFVDSSSADAYQRSSNDTDYFQGDSDISGNKLFMCLAKLKIDKMDRDYGMFGKYDVVLGTRIYADPQAADFVSLGEYETSYRLDEPEYTDGDATTDESELNYIELDNKQWGIDMAEDFGYNGRGEQSLYTELVASPYFYDDDAIQVYMGLELPSGELETGTVVFQYV